MRAVSTVRAIAIAGAILLCSAKMTSLSAQGTPTPERIDELLRSGYRPADSREQLLDCHYRALTRNITLDTLQERLARVAIDTFRRIPAPPTRSPEWTVRQSVRDSTIASVLRSRADSARFRRNVEYERAWFQAGNCNGRALRRD